MGWKAALREALDRPGRRWALVPLATARMVRRERTPCLVWPVDGGWLHWYPDGRFAAREVGSQPLHKLDRATEDIFLFNSVIRPGDTILDVGAGAGEEVHAFSRLVGPTGRVVAVEAHPTTFSLLVRNCSYSRLDNVEPVQRAVTDGEGTVAITDTDASLFNRLAGAGEGIPVESTSLDRLADRLNVGPVALLKMNIEGAEKLAIKGMERLLRRTRYVCISCHDFLVEFGADESMRTKETVKAFLVDQGFSIRTRDDDPRPWVRDYLYGIRSSV